jgi:hypothetical protein
MGSSNSKKKKVHITPLIVYNLKGKEIIKQNEGYYNLGTNRWNKDKRSELITDEKYKVMGTQDEIQGFYTFNHITENLVCDLKTQSVIFAPNSSDVADIPEKDVKSLCPFNIFGLQSKCRIVNIYDGDSFDVLTYIPLNFLYSPKYYQKERKNAEESEYKSPNIKQVTLLKTSKPSSKKISEAGLFLVFPIRLLGIDAAEASTQNGQIATELTKKLYASYNNIVYCRFGFQDKFGRMLCDLYSDENYSNYLNNYLINHPDPILGPLATAYSGGKKSELMTNLPKIKKEK